MFNDQDIKQISIKGITPAGLQKQIEHFIKGFPFITLARPAVPGDGLLNFDEVELSHYIAFFEKALGGLTVLKFVPASGAASRMFKHLFEFREQISAGSGCDELFSRDNSFNSIFYLLTNLRQIAFFNDLADSLAKAGMSIDELIADKKFSTIVDYILNTEGLDYANLPKALLKFHQYHLVSRAAAEEHLVEAAEYTRDRNNVARVHFTISPEHLGKFQALFAKVQDTYEKELGVTFEISYSVQKPSTDTIAVDENNQPVRNQDGSLLFRPGGHGALLENLNELNADLIFIKNIDNIVPDRLKEQTFRNKKLIAGYLLSMKLVIDEFLKKVRTQTVNREDISSISAFAQEKLFLELPDGFLTSPADIQCQLLFSLLNKPVRVCGMVRNEGEPGGGPFWVKGAGNRLSLQIVEASQINVHDPEQKALLAGSTHFNPVDLVCSTKDFEGHPFNLQDFVDDNTGFISLKSSGGKTLKAQELPGLWNGAMANWITIFIEVPIITFNPVKTVNDLLRKEHRGE